MSKKNSPSETDENKEVVVIDKDPAAIRRVSENIDVQVVDGSGSSPMILEEAGIKEAEILLAVTKSDETNLVACLAADLLSSSTKKLARIRDAAFDKYHDILYVVCRNKLFAPLPDAKG